MMMALKYLNLIKKLYKYFNLFNVSLICELYRIARIRSPEHGNALMCIIYKNRAFRALIFLKKFSGVFYT